MTCAPGSFQPNIDVQLQQLLMCPHYIKYIGFVCPQLPKVSQLSWNGILCPGTFHFCQFVAVVSGSRVFFIDLSGAVDLRTDTGLRIQIHRFTTCIHATAPLPGLFWLLAPQGRILSMFPPHSFHLITINIVTSHPPFLTPLVRNLSGYEPKLHCLWNLQHSCSCHCH